MFVCVSETALVNMHKSVFAVLVCVSVDDSREGIQAYKHAGVHMREWEMKEERAGGKTASIQKRKRAEEAADKHLNNQKCVEMLEFENELEWFTVAAIQKKDGWTTYNIQDSGNTQKHQVNKLPQLQSFKWPPKASN